MPSAAEAAPLDLDDALNGLCEDGRLAFLRAVSHELRTPLNAIIGFSGLLEAQIHGPLGAEQYREYAAIIGESGRRLLSLLNDVLELARAEGLDFENDPALRQLAALVRLHQADPA